MKKVISEENVNLSLIDQKLEKFLTENGLTATEPRARLVRMTLGQAADVHHFPTNIPFIAGVRQCGDKKVAYFLKRKKLAVIENFMVSNETNVGKEFEVDGVKYIQKDTLNGFPRYTPVA